MAPSGPALAHPAAQLLQDYATNGCPANCGDPWTIEQLDIAVERGAHASAKDPIAAAALHQETLEQVKGGYARLIPWKQLREKMVPQLKIQPIAAIPHKSRAFRKILDLSFAFDESFTSVNDSTDPNQAPLHSMHELGKVLPRLIHAMATVPNDEPLLFCKVDLKDGYWRMSVPETDEYNFAYVLPHQEGQDTMIVIPSSLQMGWKLSPPYFCAATETARDVAEELLDGKHGSLPQHKFEHRLLPTEIRKRLQASANWNIEGPIEPEIHHKFYHLLEVYVDDFIGVLQATNPTDTLRFVRALLHAIHSVFPPPDITGHDGHDPISEKKLDALDGLLECRKEVLGWIFDGLMRTIELPPQKITNIVELITTARRNGWMPRKQFESLRGKLRHATLGMPDGRSLMGPFDRALAAANHRNKTVQIRKGSPLDTAMADFLTLLKQMSGRPTHCKQLVPGTPSYLGYVDACLTGVGGVWLPGTMFVEPTVWRCQWPPEIQQQCIVHNPNGWITINDLEMAGFVLQFLLLEELVGPLTYLHIAVWCDNTSAISWIRKMKSNKSAIGQRLARILSMRMHIHQVSPLAALSIAGIANLLADIASRSYTDLVPASCATDFGFLTHFQSEFPLQQNHQWQLCRPSNKIFSLICSELLRKTPPMATWKRLPKSRSSIGTIGAASASELTWTPCSKVKQPPKESTSSWLSLDGSGKVMLEKDGKSCMDPSQKRWLPSARNSKWTNNPTRYTDQAQKANPNTGNV